MLQLAEKQQLRWGMEEALGEGPRVLHAPGREVGRDQIEGILVELKLLSVCDLPRKERKAIQGDAEKQVLWNLHRAVRMRRSKAVRSHAAPQRQPTWCSMLLASASAARALERYTQSGATSVDITCTNGTCPVYFLP
jgi:hypothetical protein